MNIANKLTISRLILTVIFLFLIRQSTLVSAILAAVVFTAASLTDYFDGHLARKYQLVTDFGKLMDPIADKFLILSAFLAFVGMNIVKDWMVAIILGREIIITGFRLFALKKKVVLVAEKAGKHKTVSQMMTIFMILGFIIFKRSKDLWMTWPAEMEVWIKRGIDVALVITVILALISGISYIWNNRKIIQN